MSRPVTVTSTLGSSPPIVKLTSPLSGTQRSVSMVGYHAEGRPVFAVNEFGVRTGRIAGVSLSFQGSGYMNMPIVRFVGSGFGARAEALPYNPILPGDEGKIFEVQMGSDGQGYGLSTRVEFKGGLGQEAVFLNASAYDLDGEIQSVEFISNGESLSEDLTEPYAIQNPFSVGYYEFIAIAKDDAGNVVASEPTRLNISTTRGAAPSGFMINPLPELAEDLYSTLGQEYFWNFVSTYSDTIQQAEIRLDAREERHSLTANSYIHLTSRATDSDGNITDVSFYLNNKFLGRGQKMHDSPHYVLPVDLSTFGEQPAYRIDTMIKDDSGNLVIPNNPINLNVLPASATRPDISIVVPSPNATTIATYAMGSPVLLGVDIFPKEGTLESVSLYANGRFIGDAEIQDEFEFGRKRYTLRWTAENPGRYHLTASVKDNLGTVVFTDIGVDIDIANSSGSLPPIVDLIYPMSRDANGTLSLTSTSTIRLEANASDPDGGLKSIQFFVNGEPYREKIFANNSVSQNGITYGQNWSPGFPGSHIIYVVAEDNSGNKVMSDAAVVTSTTGDAYVPIVKLSPLNSNYSIGDQIIYTADVNDTSVSYNGEGTGIGFITEVVFYVNGIPAGIETQEPYFSSWSPTEEGQYEIYAQARDSQGNIGISQIQTVSVKTNTTGSLPPLINLIYPLPRDENGSSMAITSTSTIRLEANASDPDGGLKSIQFFVNGEPYREKIFANNSVSQNGITYGENWSPGLPGIYIIHAVSEDNSGNTVMSELAVVTSTTGDLNVPIVKLSPLNSNYSIGDQIIYTADVNDTSVSYNGEGTGIGFITEVVFYVNGLPTGIETQEPYFSSWSPTEEGQYEIYAQARDSQGNIGISQIQTVSVKTNTTGSLPPLINLIYPLPRDENGSSMAITSTSTIRLEANASDPDGGLRSIQFYVNGEPYSEKILANNSISQSRIVYGENWSPGLPGIYIIHAVTEDNSGNTVMSELAVVTSTTGDLNVPIVNVSSLDSNYYIGEEIIYSVDASDEAFSYSGESSLSGYIEEVIFFVNGEQTSVDDSSPYYGSWTPMEEGHYEIYR